MTKLRKEWGITIGLSLGFLIAGYSLLFRQWSPQAAAIWTPLPVLALIYLFAIAWRNLSANHRRDETEILNSFGWGNRLTLMRGVLLSAMLGFVWLPEPIGWLAWIPGILYTLADAADFFDGYAARVTHHATRLGEILDMSFDGLGVLTAATLAVMYGKVPTWYLLVGLARYLFLAGLWIRRWLGKPNYDLPPRWSRRVFAGLQMGFLAVVLWPIFTPPGTEIAAILFGLPILFGFGRDWLFACGILKPGRGRVSPTTKLVQRWLPVGLRLVILILNAAAITAWFLDNSQLSPDLYALGLVNLIVVLMLFLGLIPRVAAIAGLVTLGFYQIFAPLTPVQVLLAIAYTLILYIGSGALSAWTPEDYLYHNQAGERRPANIGQRA